MPKNINPITIIITLDGIERINTQKMTTKRSEEYFFFTSDVSKRRIMFTVGTVDRYVDRYIGRRSGRHSIDTRSTVDRHSIDCRSTLGRLSIDTRSTLGG